MNIHIVTAAHCIDTKRATDILVVMGTNNKTDYTTTANVKQIYRHLYSKITHINDIAILELESRIEYTQFVGPVCLPRTDPKITGQYVTAMGWGALHPREKDKRDDTIQKKTNLRAIDIVSCSIDWSFHWDVEDPKILCTWSNHTDICIGDSGGPVVWYDREINRYTLMGLPALCDGCKLSLPSAHTFIPEFYDWIQKTVSRSSKPDARTCSKIG